MNEQNNKVVDMADFTASDESAVVEQSLSEIFDEFSNVISGEFKTLDLDTLEETLADQVLGDQQSGHQWTKEA